jgi:hypothetical protein
MSAPTRLLPPQVLMSLVLAAAIVLASAPLSLLIDGTDWLLITLGAAVVVGGLGALVRRVTPRALRALPVQVVGLLLLVLGVEAITGALPADGPLGVVVGQPEVIQQGLRVLFQAQAPVALAPTSRIVVLVLISLAVLALDLLCVEGRWYTGTALVLLGFLLVPALMKPDGGGWASVAGPVLGALAVLVVGSLPDHGMGEADSLRRRRRRRRARRGGLAADADGPRPESAEDADPQAPTRTRTWTTDRPGRRLALGVLGAGVVAVATPAVSAVLPRASNPPFPVDLDRINAWQGRTGMLGSAMIDDSVSVRRNLLQGREREMLRMRTDDPDPGYLRLQALTQFDGERFLAGRERGAAAETTRPSFSDRELASSKPGDAETYELTITELIGDRLPTPFPIRWSDAGDALELSSAGTTDGELMVDGGVRDLGGLEYSVAVDPTTFSPRELRAVGSRQMRIPYDNGYISVGTTPAIHALATEISQQADSDAAYDVATALADYFHENFDYSLTVTSAPGENPIDAFLADRVGYCEQFAATFALVMNDLKFPTRVSIGFTAGDVDGEERSITNHHAHAWPETWFGTEHGWVRFEPTPAAADNGVATPTFASDTPDPDESAEESPTSEAEETEEATSSEEEATEEDTTEESTSETTSAAASDAGDGSGAGIPWWGWGLGGVGLAGAVVGGGALARTGVRRRALAAREERWAQLDASQAAELAWSDVVRAVDYRARALHLLGWTRLYGKDPVVLRMDATLPPAAALEDLLDAAQEGGLDVPAGTREAAGRIAAAVTSARYAPPGGAASSPSGHDAQALREDADAVRAVVLSRGSSS